jgi:phenylalanyl-tRNA synthetase beta chain
VLNTLVAMFARYCEQPESVEMVEVAYDQPVVPGGQTQPVSRTTLPDMATWRTTARVREVNSTIGIRIEPRAMLALCDRMQLGPASLDAKEEVLTVTVPVTRSDIMHEVDVIEDVAIAYGFNNIERTVPVSHRAGKELPVNLLADLLRYEVARQGFSEILSLGLCSTAENFAHLRRPNDGSAVSLANPATLEFEVVRTSLLPGTLKTLYENLSLKFSGDGVKLFEISDVVSRRGLRTDEQRVIGGRNERRRVALHSGLASSLEVVHGLLDRIMQVLAVVPAREYSPDAHDAPLVQMLVSTGACIGEYKLEEDEHEPAFFPGRGLKVVWKPNGAKAYQEVARMGVLHPDVLANFAIPFPCTVLEMQLEPFVRE